jgi:hypothetical protein
MGDVLVVHQDDDATQPPVKMTCQHVIAWFEPAKSPADKNSNTTKPANESSPMQLRNLRAEGQTVVVTHDTDQMIARQIDYDPKRHLLIATGTEQNPVRFLTAGTGGGTADQVEWDTISWKMKTKNAIFDYRPATPGVQSPLGHKKPTTRSVK